MTQGSKGKGKDKGKNKGKEKGKDNKPRTKSNKLIPNYSPDLNMYGGYQNNDEEMFKIKYLKYKAKYLKVQAQKTHLTGGYIDFDNENELIQIEDHSTDLSNWEYQDGYNEDHNNIENGPVKVYSDIVAKYGRPTILHNEKGGLCMWIKGQTEKDFFMW